MADDDRRGVDWAKIRASLSESNVAQALRGKRLTLGTAAAIGAGVALILVVAVWIWIYWGLPRVKDADSLWAVNRLPSITFLDRNGAALGTRGPSYGHRVGLHDLPPYVPQAFLAIEDRRFYEHQGVDSMAVLRAFFANLRAGETVQGASTISQQLARNLFLSPEQTLNRKLREMVLASRIERKLTKDQILELYLNRVYLGDQAYGVDAASQRYFGKPATQISLAEAALLAGLPKAPSNLAPTSNLDAAIARQHVVLEAMQAAGFITAEQHSQALAQHIRVVSHPNTERALGFAFDLAADQARQLTPADTPDLVIQTTIDPAIEAAADQSIRTNLGNRAFGRHPLQASYMAMDRTGGIRALIGGTNYNASKFDRVTQARRQPGSAFKTFVYTAALEHGLDTEDVRFDEPVVINGWQPHNYDEGYRGAMTLRTAFALSINTVAAEVANEIGPANVAAVARRLGVSTMPSASQPVPPSIALGSIEVTLWDMVTAFGAYMNDGAQVQPYIVESVSDAAGHQLYRHTPTDPKSATRVLAPEIAERMTSMMGAVVIRGTGTAARLGDRDVAGKTGTSTDYRDAWFIGYTADYVAGVWLGHDDFTPMARITGGTIPAQIWADSMRVAHRGIDPHPLPGIEQPVYTPDQNEVASFFDSLAQAFSGGDEPHTDEPPPDDSHDTF